MKRWAAELGLWLVLPVAMVAQAANGSEWWNGAARWKRLLTLLAMVGSLLGAVFGAGWGAAAAWGPVGSLPERMEALELEQQRTDGRVRRIEQDVRWLVCWARDRDGVEQLARCLGP